jgi:hypothetical protein
VGAEETARKVLARARRVRNEVFILVELRRLFVERRSFLK